jgi:hypothetical protein
MVSGLAAYAMKRCSMKRKSSCTYKLRDVPVKYTRGKLNPGVTLDSAKIKSPGRAFAGSEADKSNQPFRRGKQSVTAQAKARWDQCQPAGWSNSPPTQF